MTVTTVYAVDPDAVGLTRLIQRRRDLGLDRYDEVWVGILHMAPAPHLDHQTLVSRSRACWPCRPSEPGSPRSLLA